MRENSVTSWSAVARRQLRHRFGKPRNTQSTRKSFCSGCLFDFVWFVYFVVQPICESGVSRLVGIPPPSKIFPLHGGRVLERCVHGRSNGKQAAPKCAAKFFGHGCDRLSPIGIRQNGIRLIPMLGVIAICASFVNLHCPIRMRPVGKFAHSP